MIESIALAAALHSSCTTTRTYEHLTTAAEQEWRWETKAACGKNYTETLRVSRAYRTGAVSLEKLTRVERPYPHYRQTEWLQTISAKGKVSVRVTVTSA